MLNTIKLKSNEIIIVGDTHGINEFKDIVERFVPNDSCVVHIGDCGIGFSRRDGERIKKVDKICKDKNIQVYIIRGNHDNPYYWDNDVFELTNVKLVKDYTRLIFPNTREALCVGGGVSVDRIDRIKGVSYWKDEITQYLPEYCTPCDYMFIHDAPSYCNLPTVSLKQNFRYYVEKDSKIMSDAQLQRETIDKIVALCKPKKIVGGHFHNSISERVNDIDYRCLNINEIYPFFA